MLGSFIGGLILVSTLGGSAPQEAAGAAAAVAFGVLPYVFTRALEEFFSNDRYEAMAQALTALKSIDQRLGKSETNPQSGLGPPPRFDLSAPR
jgi:hypothetical protein